MAMTLKSLTREYRADKKKLEKLSKKIDALQMQIVTIRNNASELSKEAQNKKILIDFCIETGSTPIEANLSYTLDEMKNAINHLYFSNYATIEQYGAIGAMGASGGSTNYIYTGLTGGTGGGNYSTIGQGHSITNTGNISLTGGLGQTVYKSRTP